MTKPMRKQLTTRPDLVSANWKALLQVRACVWLHVLSICVRLRVDRRLGTCTLSLEADKGINRNDEEG